MGRKRFFSGIQPTGQIHIGNYLGAMQNWINLANSGEYEAIACIVDYHAITIPYETQEMPKRVFEAAATIMACGLDENSLLFVQSHVPEHTELAWIFNSVAMVGELERMTQFKDKSKVKGISVNAGLFTYPVLQAADILLYKAGYVPVGEDQLQHLELSREIARRFNNRFGETFPEPKELLTKAKRIMGLDGENKMSKSLNNTLAVMDPYDVIKKKLASAKTDEKRLRKTDPGVPEDCNVYTSYHRYFSEKDLPEIEKNCTSASIGCVQCKKLLLENMESTLGPIREKYQSLVDNPKKVHDFLEHSANKCRAIAKETMQEVREKMGIAFRS